jgi:hypothetical protein
MRAVAPAALLTGSTAVLALADITHFGSRLGEPARRVAGIIGICLIFTSWDFRSPIVCASEC